MNAYAARSGVLLGLRVGSKVELAHADSFHQEAEHPQGLQVGILHLGRVLLSHDPILEQRVQIA